MSNYVSAAVVGPSAGCRELLGALCQSILRAPKHRSHNGTVFKAERCDLRGGVDVLKPERISEADLCADFAEFAAWHTHCIFEQLNGFPGWGGISYSIVTEWS